VIADVDTGAGTARCDLSRAFDLSVPIYFDERSARAFGLPHASHEPFRAGAFVGDVAQGGSVNCEVLELAPHGNGTHTESVGHVVGDPISVHDVAPRALLHTRVVTVAPARLGDCDETYGGAHADDDLVVTRAALLSAWPGGGGERALVLRTGGFRESYNGTNPPYLTDDAARLLRERAIDHVLVDLPSLDKEDDGGALSAHRVFFGLAPDQKALNHQTLPPRTITELCHVPAECADGRYLLSLGVAPFVTDAAPARPLLFALED
jgi:kynurenine formamidase